MKKIKIPVLLMVIMSTMAFAPKAAAQLKFDMYADFFPELMRYTAPFNDYANINKDDLYAGAGTFDLLSSSSEGAVGLQNELRLSLNFLGRNMSWYLQLALDDYIRPDGGLMIHNDMFIGYNILLNQTFNEWYFKGNAGIFSVYAGRTSDYGKVDRFESGFDNFLAAIVTNGAGAVERFSGYGVVTPRIRTSEYKMINTINPDPTDPSKLWTKYRRNNLSFNIVESNNFLPKLNIYNDFGFIKQAYFSASAFINPFTVQIAGDLGNTSDVYPHDVWNGYESSYIKLNGGVRVSGEKIFGGYLTFDAVYKFRGGDPNTVNDPDPEFIPGDEPPYIQPDGFGITAHSFGLYANILNLPEIELGIGYTGLFRVFEKNADEYLWVPVYPDNPKDGVLRFESPFFHGIDLRARYTGIPQLTITSHNNISFSQIKGNSDDRIFTTSLKGAGIENKSPRIFANESESWLALYNAVSFNYQFSDKLTAAVQAANRYGMYSIDSGGDKDTVAVNTLGITAFAAYRFNNSILVQAGLQFLMDWYSWQNAWQTVEGQHNDINGIKMYFAVPLRFKVNF